MRDISCRLFLLLSFFTAFVHASTLVPDPGLIAADTSDLINLAAPNSAGISSNHFDRVDLNKPLKIINVSKTGTLPAKLFIIESRELNLRSSIEIVGEQADLLLLNKTAGSLFVCNSCSFRNASRVTLAFAVANLAADGLPRNLSPIGGADLVVNNLDARGIGAMDLVGSSISINGHIDTRLSASYAGGGFQINESGNLIVGYGNVNIFHGVNLDYQTQALSQGAVNSQLVVNGKITTAAANIISSKPVLITGTIDTTSDILSTLTYNQKIAALEESINITSLTQGADITQNGQLHSDNNVNLSSGGNLYMNGTVTAKQLHVIAKDALINRGNINVAKVEVATGSIENNGKIVGTNIQLASEYSIQNRFGGKIYADVIGLSSQKSVIRNGSQYPFKPKHDLSLVLLPDPNLTRLGTINGIPFDGATKVSDLSAHIIGKKITISANQNVENINPYFEVAADLMEWENHNGKIINFASVDQVQLIAEDELNIDSGTYVINSSAIMGVNNPQGHFQVVAPHIANERYNTQVVIQPFERKEISANNTVTTTTGIESRELVYSPPGVIYSFAKLGFNMTVNGGSFVNNTAYFEVLNDAQFLTTTGTGENRTTSLGQVTSIGLALQDKPSNQTSYRVIDTSYCSKLGSIVGFSVYQACMASQNYRVIDVSGQTEEQMYGTLFSVKGNINGQSSKFYGTNHKTIDDMRKRLINDELAKNQYQLVLKTVTGIGEQREEEFEMDWASISTSRLSDDGKFIDILTGQGWVNREGDYTYAVTSVVDEDTGEEGVIGYLEYAEGITTYYQRVLINVEDFLKQKYEQMKTALVNMLNAFKNWWNS